MPEAHDTDNGPCACGAWHLPGEAAARDRLERRLNDPTARDLVRTQRANESNAASAEHWRERAVALERENARLRRERDELATLADDQRAALDSARTQMIAAGAALDVADVGAHRGTMAQRINELAFARDCERRAGQSLDGQATRAWNAASRHQRAAIAWKALAKKYRAEARDDMGQRLYGHGSDR
jgi:hypothetical protein